MAEKKEKLTVAFNSYEADQLNSLQYSYLFGKSRLSYIPSVNEILKATVMYALLRTKQHAGVRKAFANGFLKRRNLGLQEHEEEEVGSETDMFTEKEKEEARLAEETVREKSKLQHPKIGNYSFYFGEKELEQVSQLKEDVSKVSGISIDNISNTEMVRETLHFIFERKVRNLAFRYMTYVGHLYDLRPVISVILGEIHRYPDDGYLGELLYDFSDHNERNMFNELGKDRKLAEAFEKAFLANSDITSAKDNSKLIYGYFSEVGNFDMYLSFLGAELMYYTARLNSTEIPDALLYVVENDRKKSVSRISVDLFKFYLEVLYDVSDELKKRVNARE